MKMHINRRNFLLGSLSTAAVTMTPLKATATTEAGKKNKLQYVHCGKINSTDLRHFYHAATTAEQS